MIFRVALPLYGAYVVASLLLYRHRIAKHIGHDPVVVHPFVDRDRPHRYLEQVLLASAVAAIGDIGLNAVATDWVSIHLAIPALRESVVMRWIGFVVVAVGLGISSVAICQMGDSWRIGIDAEGPSALATRGLYAHVRHPIYSGMLLAIVGLAAMTGDILAVSIVVACCVALPIQARLEEEFLLSRHGTKYRWYLQRTGRFWPVRKRSGKAGGPEWPRDPS